MLLAHVDEVKRLQARHKVNKLNQKGYGTLQAFLLLEMQSLPLSMSCIAESYCAFRSRDLTLDLTSLLFKSTKFGSPAGSITYPT